MNNYNVLADFIVHKYIDKISGNDLGERIIGEEPFEIIMTGLLAENRVEQTFDGDYRENESTRFQSIPSISLKCCVKKNDESKIKIFPKGLLFYTVKPEYEEIVEHCLEQESEKDHKKYSSIDELIKIYPDKIFTFPKVYKKIDISDVFKEGLELNLRDSFGQVHFKDLINQNLRSFIANIKDEIKVVNDNSISYKDLENEDKFNLVCSVKDQVILPSWSFDIVTSLSESQDGYVLYVRMVNSTEKPKNNYGFLPQIFNAGIDIVGNEATEFLEIKLNYFKDNYKERKKCYSVGENTSSSFNEKTNTISTENIPIYYQYRTKTNDRFNGYIEFQKLIDDPIGNLEYIYQQMQKDLENRYKEFNDYKDNLNYLARDKFERALTDYEQEVKRFHYGIEQIKYKDLVYRAFVLMNKTFKTEVKGDHRSYSGWRLFQIVFIVSLICEVIESEYKDDLSIKNAVGVETANLLYFPTGGGKTEAFLGVATFTMFFDRLRGKNVGVTGILKYPLRLLAAQQLERVLTIVMKANIVRENEEDIKNTTPFAVGLLIGSSNTPNKVYENDIYNNGSKAILNGDEQSLNEGYRFIDVCPICGKKSVNVMFDTNDWRLKHVCNNPDCSVIELPLMIIDNEIYRYMPSLVVSTIDKMSALGFSGEFKQLMGQVRYRCKKHGYTWQDVCAGKYNCGGEIVSVDKLKDPIPTLFIQDEMHLVKESLGTFDSHYESFIKYYAENLVPKSQRKRIKFIGATATISMYEEQIKHLYHLRGRRFPCEYPSIKQGKDFYSYIDNTDITRIILGYAPYGRSIYRGMWEAVYNMRLIVCDMMLNIEKYHKMLVENGYTGSEEELKESLYDYWIELVYNNRKDDAMNLENSFQNQANDRLQAKGLPVFKCEQMTSDEDFQKVRKILFDIERNRKNIESKNLILATSTISHGVDEDSFNNMFFFGMPNTNAEYIQAYSRSGRKYTGIVVDIIRLLRVRDRAYLKNFVLFHENKDDFVESVSINRWAKNAVYNTLPGLLNGLFLQYYPVELGVNTLNKTNRVKNYLLDGTITVDDVIKKLIGIYGCSKTEKLSFNYQKVIETEVREILEAIKNGIYDNKATLSESIKNVYRRHLAPMSSLRDTEETINVSIGDDKI